MKITKPVLQDMIERTNVYQALSGSNFYAFLCEQYNGYYLHVYRFDEKGEDCNYTSLGGGTKKDCFQLVYRFRDEYYGYMHPQNKLTRMQAKKMCQLVGIDFNADFHSLNSEFVEILLAYAKSTKYRLPKNANGSLARYFFYSLARLKGAK